jgi:hypothetical protein
MEEVRTKWSFKIASTNCWSSCPTGCTEAPSMNVLLKEQEREEGHEEEDESLRG